MNLKLLAAIALISFSVTAQAVTPYSPTQGQAMSQQDTEKNKKLGESYLTANKTKPGVIVLPDGLQYKIIKPGTGDKPSLNDIVSVDYDGTFIDGTEFDSSSKHGGPAKFGVGQVIAGWTEILQLMPVGSIWEVYIPSDLAYGDDGAPPAIPPGATLIFKIKLISIGK